MKDILDRFKRFRQEIHDGEIYRSIEHHARHNWIVSADPSLFSGFNTQDFNIIVDRFLNDISLDSAKKDIIRQNITHASALWSDSQFIDQFTGSGYTELEIERLLWIYKHFVQVYHSAVRQSIDCNTEKYRVDFAESIDLINSIAEIGANFARKVDGSDILFCNRTIPTKAVIVSDLQSFLSELNLSSPQRRFWRGESSVNYLLSSSIHRGTAQAYESENFIDANRKLSGSMPGETVIEKLIQLQHYGYPTRLIDITENPLVSLFFACSGDSLCEYAKVIEFLPPATVIHYDDDERTKTTACVATIPEYFHKMSDLEVESQLNLFRRRLANDGVTKESSDNLASEINESLIFLAKQANPRIVAQSGAFILVGDTLGKLQPSRNHYQWVNKLYCIPKHCKRSILRELKTLGINHRTLFPDIEGHSAAIKDDSVLLYKLPRSH